MPLQKALPHSFVVTARTPLTDRQVLRERRRTLHTISELSPSTGALPDWSESPEVPNSKTSNNGGPDGNSRGKGTKSTGRNWRRSLPSQGLESEHSVPTTPSILVTPAGPATFRRSMTEPLKASSCAQCGSGAGTREHGKHQHKRNSLNSSIRNRHSQSHLSPVVEGDHSPSGLARNGSPMKQSGSDKSPRGEGWNAWREKERMKLEQAVVEAKGRREREGRGINTGSSSTLPSMSPRPRPRPGQMKRHDSKHELSQHYQGHSTHRVPTPLMRRVSAGQMGTQPASNTPNGYAMKRASTGDYPHVAPHRIGIQRSFSANSNSTGPPLPTLHPPMPQLNRSASPRSFSGPVPHTHYPPSRTPSSPSLRTSPDSSPPSSQYGNMSGKSRPTSQASSASRKPGPQAQQRRDQGRLEPFPTLTDPRTPNARARPQAQHSPTITPPDFKRAASQPSQSPSRYRSRSQSSHRSSAHGPTSRDNPPPPPRQNSKVGLLVEREKLVQWRAENDKAELEKSARERIKERVRIANEMEQQREKELVRVQRKSERGLFCGLFGRA